MQTYFQPMQELTVVLFCTWKFAATFPLAIYVFQMSITETILFTNLGGLLGMIVSILVSKGLIGVFRKLFKLKNSQKKRKRFSRRSRRLAKIRAKYGLHGIVVLTPILLSIPVGTFLITRYYYRHKLNYLYLLASQIAWSLLYVLFYYRIKYFFF